MHGTRGIIARRAGRLRAGLTGVLMRSAAETTGWTYEAAILRILRENEAIGLDHVVELAAEEAMVAESSVGAWTSDVGIWGPALFRREAISAMTRMFGTSLILEGSGDGPWLVVPVAAR